MIQHTILVPILSDTYRVNHAQARWDAWYDYLREAFGGYTDCGPAMGEWEGCRDESRIFIVAHDRDRSAEIAKIVKKLFDQRAVYIATCNAQIL